MKNAVKLFSFIIILLIFTKKELFAVEAFGGLPAINVDANSNGGTTYSLSLQILLLMSLLTVLPSLIL